MSWTFRQTKFDKSLRCSHWQSIQTRLTHYISMPTTIYGCHIISGNRKKKHGHYFKSGVDSTNCVTMKY